MACNIKEFSCKIVESNKLLEDSESELQFGTENILKYENSYAVIDKHENLIQHGIQGLCFKQEVDKHEGREIDSAIQFMAEDRLHCEIGCVDSNVVKKCEKTEENFMERESHEFNIKPEEISIKTDNGETSRFENSTKVSVSVEETAYYCGRCAYTSIHREQLKDHMQTHEKSLENGTAHKKTLSPKRVPEITIYNCQICEYHTKYRQHIKTHMLIHKSTSEVTMYKCAECTYQTKHKNCLQRHMKSHKNISEVTVYKCDLCSYQTRRNDTLRKHMQTHNQLLESPLDENASDAAPSQCGTCLYKTSNKRNLIVHMLSHRQTVFKCELCEYQTKQKRHLTTHIRTHKSSNEVAIYKCKNCDYQTKSSGSLRTHKWTHKNAGVTHRCQVCSYETKNKSNFRRHEKAKHGSRDQMTG